jgi:hypothetical protein
MSLLQTKQGIVEWTREVLGITPDARVEMKLGHALELLGSGHREDKQAGAHIIKEIADAASLHATCQAVAKLFDSRSVASVLEAELKITRHDPTVHAALSRAKESSDTLQEIAAFDASLPRMDPGALRIVDSAMSPSGTNRQRRAA